MPEVMRELAAAQARTEAALARTDQRIEELAAAQARTEQTVKELVAAQMRTEWRLGDVQRDLGKLKGQALERDCVDKAPAVFGAWLRRVRVVLPGGLDATTEDRLLAHLTDAEFQDVLWLDVALRGRLAHAADQPEVYLAVEVSEVIDREDVERAQRRARLLRKAGLVAVPAVAGEKVSGDTAVLLREVPVAVALDGHCEGWEKALAAAVP